MTAGVGRTDLLRAAELLDYPEVRTARITPDEAGWRLFADRSTPIERQAVLERLAPWLSPELVATEAARSRLRSWAALGRPVLNRQSIAHNLSVLGLDRLRPMCIAAIRRMPPPVVHFMLHHVWILGTERSAAGWTWQAPRVPDPLQLIVLDGTRDASELWTVLAHEAAHAWLLQAAPQAFVTTLPERWARTAKLRRLAAAWGRHEQLARARARDELQAARLARRWGFMGPAADPEACASSAYWATLP